MFMAGGREIIQKRVESGQADMASLSKAAGKNTAYIQQFLKRGVPVELPEKVREALAPHLGVHADALREGGKALIAPAPDLFRSGSDVVPAPNVAFPGRRTHPITAQCEVRGIVAAGDDGQFVVNLSEQPLEFVDLPSALVGVPDLFALFVAGESMAGVWMPGDIVYVSRRRPVTKDAYVVVLVSAGDGEPPQAFLKQFVGQDNENVWLRQYNPAMELAIERRRVQEMWRALHWREWAV